MSVAYAGWSAAVERGWRRLRCSVSMRGVRTGAHFPGRCQIESVSKMALEHSPLARADQT